MSQTTRIKLSDAVDSDTWDRLQAARLRRPPHADPLSVYSPAQLLLASLPYTPELLEVIADAAPLVDLSAATRLWGPWTPTEVFDAASRLVDRMHPGDAHEFLKRLAQGMSPYAVGALLDSRDVPVSRAWAAANAAPPANSPAALTPTQVSNALWASTFDPIVLFDLWWRGYGVSAEDVHTFLTTPYVPRPDQAVWYLAAMAPTAELRLHLVARWHTDCDEDAPLVEVASAPEALSVWVECLTKHEDCDRKPASEFMLAVVDCHPQDPEAWAQAMEHLFAAPIRPGTRRAELVERLTQIPHLQEHLEERAKAVCELASPFRDREKLLKALTIDPADWADWLSRLSNQQIMRLWDDLQHRQLSLLRSDWRVTTRFVALKAYVAEFSGATVDPVPVPLRPIYLDDFERLGFRVDEKPSDPRPRPGFPWDVTANLLAAVCGLSPARWALVFHLVNRSALTAAELVELVASADDALP